jgi:iron complex outermembrane receptor protein
VVAATLSGGLASAAIAADAPPPPPAAAATNNTSVEELVVTSKRADKEQEAPKPATLVTGTALEEAHIDSVVNLPNILPSANFHAYNANNMVLQVRGLGAGSVSAGQFGQTGVYVDDMFQGRQNALVYALHDIDNVDLIPGPQGTSSGAVSIGGTLLINTALPSFTPGGIVSATVGNSGAPSNQLTGTKKFWGAVTGPVVDDVDAIRLTAYSDRQNGWARNIVSGATVDDSASQGARFQNLFKTDDFSLRFLASYDNTGQHAGQPLWNSNEISASNKTTFQQLLNSVSSKLTIPGYVIPTNSDTTDINHNQNFEGHTARVSAAANWDISNHLTLTSITAWQNYKIWPNNDSDWTALDITRQGGSHNWTTQKSEEIRLNSHDNDLVDWTGGFFYFHQRGNQISDTQEGPDYAAITTWKSTFGPQSKWTSANVANLADETNAWTESETEALYGQATWKLDSQWAVVTGLRETWDHRNVVAGTSFTNPGNGNFTAAQAAAILNTTFLQGQGGAVSSNNLGGTIGLNYKPDSNILLYTSFNRGYLPAGTQTSALSNAALESGGAYGFKQEKILDGEIGAKTKWLDDSLIANLALYRATLFNYQASVTTIDPVTTSSVSYTANIKAVNIKGAELTGSYQPTSWLKLGTASSYNLAQYQSYRNAGCAPEYTAKVCDLTGSRVYGAPHWIINLWDEVSQPVAEDAVAYLRTEYNHQSGSYIQSNNAEQSWQGAWGNVNAQLGVRLRGGDVDLSIWAHNLFNVQYMTYQTTGNNANWAIFSDPLEAGITLNVKF